MMSTDSPLATRLAALVVAIALAAAVGACGSSDDDAGDANASDQAASDTNAGGSSTDAAAGSDEDQIEAVYTKLVAAIYDGDGKTACTYLAPQARKDIESRYKSPCSVYIKDNLGDLAKERPRIYSLQVQGDRALAKAGTPKTNKYPVPFTKSDDGTWQVSGGY